MAAPMVAGHRPGRLRSRVADVLATGAARMHGKHLEAEELTRIFREYPAVQALRQFWEGGCRIIPVPVWPIRGIDQRFLGVHRIEQAEELRVVLRLKHGLRAKPD